MVNDLSNYWKIYNQEKKKLLQKVIDFNNKNKFNFLEKENYNHIRDILSLTLLNIKSDRKKVKILDYGSNLLTISNLNNKINTSNFSFIIYDPFIGDVNYNYKIKNINYKIINDHKKIIKDQFALINFGSSVQYQHNFFSNFEKLNLNKTKFIVFTSTPISLSKTYLSKQSNHNYLTQKIYSFDYLVNKLKSKKFKLIFKSRNDDKYIACKKKLHKTFSLNLVFKK
tara:strand:+ start:592 stop:1269 length:678 start_codon:yes stop_codon:yes gene_type:complete